MSAPTDPPSSSVDALDGRVSEVSDVRATSLASPAVDARMVQAWRVWLGQLATDAEAALAAALAYRTLDPEQRTQWLEVLEHDSPALDVPRIALYAPLLAVEHDAARRERIAHALGPVPAEARPQATRTFAGGAGGNARIATLIRPLYLDFVQVLACRFTPGEQIDWVKHEPIVDLARAPKAGDKIEGVTMEAVPLKSMVDDLARTIVAHRRRGLDLPEALAVFADLFGPDESALCPEPES